MKKFAKWIGGGLGWAVGGPIGAIIGFAVGSMVGNTPEGREGENNPVSNGQRYQTSQDDFSKSLLILSAAVMKADGKVLKSELNYVKAFFAKQFGETYTQDLMLILKEILKQDIPTKQVCEQIRYYMQHPMRLQLMHYLFGIANADGHVDSTEVDIIKRIAYDLGISTPDFESIQAMFYNDTKAAYTILEITPNASDDELKKAYRKMAIKYHPDKLESLGEAHKKAAKDKFIKVQQAYEAIKKERGLS